MTEPTPETVEAVRVAIAPWLPPAMDYQLMVEAARAAIIAATWPATDSPIGYTVAAIDPASGEFDGLTGDVHAALNCAQDEARDTRTLATRMGHDRRHVVCALVPVEENGSG